VRCRWLSFVQNATKWFGSPTPRSGQDPCSVKMDSRPTRSRSRTGSRGTARPSTTVILERLRDLWASCETAKSKVESGPVNAECCSRLRTVWLPETDRTCPSSPVRQQLSTVSIGTIWGRVSWRRVAWHPAVPGRVRGRMICRWLRPEIEERPLATELARRFECLIAPASRLLTRELERQAGDNEGCEKDRQKPLSSASEGDGLALGGVEGLGSAGVSAIANLHGMTSRFDCYLDRGVHFERSGILTINHDVVRSTTDLRSDRFVLQLESCRHLQALFCVGRVGRFAHLLPLCHPPPLEPYLGGRPVRRISANSL